MLSDKKPVSTHRTRGTTHVDTMEMKGDSKKTFRERLDKALSVQLRPTDSDLNRRLTGAKSAKESLITLVSHKHI